MLGRYLDLGSPVADHPLNAGVVAWWLGLPHNSGASTLFDLCNKNHGTLSNFAIPASSTSGWKAGNWHGNPYQLLNFDGTDDYIQITNPSATYTAVTVEALFTYDSSTQADSRLAEKGANSEWTLALRPSSGVTWDIAFYNRFAGTADYYAAGIPAGTLVNGQIYHVVGTIAADGYARIYLNGILKGTAAISGGVPSGARSGNLELGRYSPGGPYNGKFGLWSLRYSHAAATTDMVRLLYAQSVSHYPDTLKRYSPRVSVFGGYVPGGGGFSDATGSSSLTFSASAAGSSLASAAGSSSITFTPTAAGSPLADATGTASLAFTVSATGSSLADADGSSALTFTPTAAGSALADATGAATLAFTASAVGSSIADAAGTAALTFTASASSGGFEDATGSATLTFAASATATGSALVSATGSSSLTFTASATGAPIASATGTATVTFTCSAVGSDGTVVVSLPPGGVIRRADTRRVIRPVTPPGRVVRRADTRRTLPRGDP